MNTLEVDFNNFTGRAYKQPPAIDQTLQLKNAFFAGAVQMFSNMNALGDLSEEDALVHINKMHTEMDSHFDNVTSQAADAVEAAKKGHVADIHVGDIIGADELSQLDVDGLRISLPEAELHTKDAVVDLTHIYKHYATTPAKQSTDFVTALNARISVFCAALRPITGKLALIDYLHELANEEQEICFEQITSDQMAAMKQAENRTKH